MNGFVHDIGIGVAMGIPMLVVVGPIALLLIDVGSRRGLRSATPAALGVALGDVLLAMVVAVGGTALASVLTPVAGWFRVVAAAMVAGLALHVVHTVRRTREIGDVAGSMPSMPSVVLDPGPTSGTASGTASDPSSAPVLLLAGAPSTPAADAAGAVRVADAVLGRDAVGGAGADRSGVGGSGARGAWAGSSGGVGDAAVAAARAGAAGGAGRLMGGFTALTLANPLTLLVYVGLVVGGGSGVGTAGWVVGMGVASLVVHSSWVGVGHVMGTAVPPAALRALRYVAAVLLLGLALHMALR